MKKTKAILMALCAVLLVAASVMGTLAYLTSTDTVTNTFTVGNVQIKLDEAKVGEDGKALTGDAAERVTGNKYHLLPGHKYDKDPIVHVAADSEDCYLFVKVENGIASIEAATTIADQMTANGWTLVSGTTNVYAYEEVASAGDNVDVFKTFTISGDVSNEKLAGGTPVDPSDPTGATTPSYGNAQVIVTAYAIQADGFADKTAAEIWTAAKFN